jgi:hypothetical protein
MKPTITVMRVLAVAAGLIAASPARSAPPASPVTIQHIAVQFLYETSGTLSEDIAPPSHFTPWNSVIGEGDAKESAHDVLVTAILTSPENEVVLDQPLVLVAKGPGGKVLAQRKFGYRLLEHGRFVAALFLPDAACAGKVTIQVSYGAQRSATSVNLDCGE